MSSRRLFNKKRKQRNKAQIRKYQPKGGLLLHYHLKDNLQQFKQELGNSPEIVIGEFEMGNQKVPIGAIHSSGLADQKMISDFVTRSLMIESVNEISINHVSEKNIFDFIKDNALTIGEVKVVKDWNGYYYRFFW